MKLEHFLTPYTKINSKWIKNLNVRPETIKLQEENIYRTLSSINCSKILYDPPPRWMEIKTKIYQWDLIKLKGFCTMKETVSKVKRQSSEWEKTIPKESTDKELISKIHKQLMQLNVRKINNPIKEWTDKRTEQTFLQRRHTHRWLTNTWKVAQRHSLSEKYKSKQQWPSHNVQNGCYQKIYR